MGFFVLDFNFSVCQKHTKLKIQKDPEKIMKDTIYEKYTVLQILEFLNAFLLFFIILFKKLIKVLFFGRFFGI